MTRFLTAGRPRRPSAGRGGGHPLAGLRPADDPPWTPPWRRGPVDRRFDPCGGEPIQAPALDEAARRRAVITLIAVMGRHLR